MTTPARLRLLLTISLLFAAVPAIQAQDPDALQRLRAASDLTSLDQPGSAPWHLKLSVTLTEKSGVKGAGTIEEWWSDATHFRLSFDLPGCNTTLVRQGETALHTAGAAPPPSLFSFLLLQVVHPIRLRDESAALRPTVTQVSTGGVSLDAVQLLQPGEDTAQASNDGPVYYLVPGTSDFVALAQRSMTAARLNKGKLRGKEIPIDLSVSADGKPLASTHVEQLQSQTVPYQQASDAVDLEPDPNQGSPPRQGFVPGKLLKSVPPAFPPLRKRQNRSGEVYLDVVVGPDGHVQSAKPLYSVDPDFAAASLDAVRRYVFSPSLLNGVPAPLQVVIMIHFISFRR